MYSITHPQIDSWSINFASISRKINSIDGNPQKWNCKSVAFRLPRSRIQIMNWYHFLLTCFAWLVSIKPHRPISHWWFQTDSWWLTLLFDYLTIGCKIDIRYNRCINVPRSNYGNVECRDGRFCSEWMTPGSYSSLKVRNRKLLYVCNSIVCIVFLILFYHLNNKTTLVIHHSILS